MHRLTAVLLLLFFTLPVCGCSAAGQVENQAYVIALGVDRSADGGVELSVQVPKISGGQSTSEDGSSAEEYLPVSVRADSYEHAVERLNWAMPKDMNLSQIELIVLSEEIAAERYCRELIDRISNTERLFAAANVVICSGKAKAFVEALSPTLGSRLSADISAALEHYRSIGIISGSSLAYLNYLSNSVYSDPTVAYAACVPADQEDNSAPASALSYQSLSAALSEEVQSPIEIRYLGIAILADGSLQGVLRGDQAILANLISNRLDCFRYTCGGESLEFTPVGKCRVQIDTNADPVRIRLSLHLTVADQEYIPEEYVMRDVLERDMREVIAAAQRINADPFGFAEIAAGNFWTLEDWIAYNWRQRFEQAEVEIKLRFTHADT